MNKHFTLLAAAVLSLVACNNENEPVSEPSQVRIEPVITRSLSLNFKDGNRIGLNIIKSDGQKYADNACLTYSGTAFAGDLKWYGNGTETSILQAMYPYQEGGFPEKFTVETDQSAGTDASDLMFASKTDVRPGSAPELMVFRHALAQLVVILDNQAGASVSGVTVRNLIPTAVVSAGDNHSFTATVDPDASAADIKAEEMEAGKKYCVVVAPQPFDKFEVVLDIPGASSIVTDVDAAEIKAGYSYNVSITVSADKVNASIGGEIGNWEEGDNLDGKPAEPSFEEHDGYFIYEGVRYTTATMKDGNVWMTQNMRLVPKGLSPSSDLGKVDAGVYFPVVMNSDNTAAEFSTDEDVVASNGYLYQIETALGVPVGSVLTIEAAQALNGAQGICPDGWHVPTDKDMVGLVGKIASYTYADGESADKAPYYDQSLQNASIALLNADGFNADAWGAVTIQDFTKTSASLMGYLKTNPSKIQSGFLCGSTYAACSYNTKDDPESGIKNLQFWGFMPMASNGTFNGSKVSIRIASPLRCVKDQ